MRYLAVYGAMADSDDLGNKRGSTWDTGVPSLQYELNDDR